MNVRMIVLAASAASLFSLCACSGTKEALGLVKDSPDEFRVVKRAPLAMPPEYNLRPPRAGAPRPQEQSTDEQAREAVFGGQNAKTPKSASSAENFLLEKSGAMKADPNIREKVAEDLAAQEKEEQPIGTRLFGIGGNKDDNADVVNAEEESARLQDAKTHTTKTHTTKDAVKSVKEKTKK